MKSISALLFSFFPLFCFAAEIKEGDYTINWFIVDAFYSQNVTITNISGVSGDVSRHFDVLIQDNGSLKESTKDIQRVRGVAYESHIYFVIPNAGVAGVAAFYFDISNEGANGSYAGNGYAQYQTPDDLKHEFKFYVEKSEKKK